MKSSRLPPLSSLRTFHAVAGCLSFKGAASQLNVSATAVSHQIRLLESVLECRVFERSAQGVKLTEAGQLLYTGTQSAFSSLEDAVKKIGQARQSPALTVTTTSNFLTNWLIPRLADFNEQYPHIDVHLHTSVELIDLKKRTVDVGIRYREAPESDLHCTLLCEDRFIVVASPNLNLKKPDDLNNVTLLHVDNRHVPAELPDWDNWKRLYGPETLNINRGLHFSEEPHALQAAVAGTGAVIASKLLVGDLIQRGVLVAPFEDSLPGANYYLVTLEEAVERAEIVVLREWVQRMLAC
ncbi:TPA: LysR family transcriptional regulator [Enterobacter asburiae]|nr:LysR family transcriptional regulator [Enterobacter asburiae]